MAKSWAALPRTRWIFELFSVCSIAVRMDWHFQSEGLGLCTFTSSLWWVTPWLRWVICHFLCIHSCSSRSYATFFVFTSSQRANLCCSRTLLPPFFAANAKSQLQKSEYQHIFTLWPPFFTTSARWNLQDNGFQHRFTLWPKQITEIKVNDLWLRGFNFNSQRSGNPLNRSSIPRLWLFIFTKHPLPHTHNFSIPPNTHFLFQDSLSLPYIRCLIKAYRPIHACSSYIWVVIDLITLSPQHSFPSIYHEHRLATTASSPPYSLILIRHQPVDSPGLVLLSLWCADLQ